MAITPQIGAKDVVKVCIEESFHMDGPKYNKIGETLGPLSTTSSHLKDQGGSFKLSSYRHLYTWLICTLGRYFVRVFAGFCDS